ncbi:MAG: tRNA adenosine(34) deaminase TadA [Thermodesulfobacteriota bacterium]
MHSDLEHWMALAHKEAEKAFREEEVPIGAVLIAPGGEMLAKDHNRTRQLHDPTAHAEILVLRKAARVLANFRLPGTTLLVTIEPCLMCAGAVLQARVERVVFGAADPKAGALGTLYDVSNDQRLNHRFEVVAGIRETECRALLQKFFKVKRDK